jgi:chemotaxis protein methyltransferase WspC
MKPLENLLRQVIGLDTASVGPASIERAVRLRMTRLGLRRVEDYRHLIQSSPDEWNELVESVVVPETWFFRDPEPFPVFVQLALKEWLPAHPTGLLRVLSVPCATGEEPYSLAMALLDAGFPQERFLIQGIDISRRALQRAGRALYGKYSFRGRNLALRHRHFRRTADGYLLNSAVRRTVHFRQGNLLEDDAPADRNVYDFIFCRNLLIYFDGEARSKALHRLDRLLSPAGTLFLGPAEIPLAVGHGFVSADIHMAFACRKAGRTGRLQPGRTAAWSAAPSDGELPGESTPRSRPATDLNLAWSLANAGRLEEAAAICQAHLRFHGASATAYYLLGLVHDAHGRRHAAEYYRKALFFEPDHWEALWQLALLAQKEGDLNVAAAWKRRAQRARQKAAMTYERR